MFDGFLEDGGVELVHDARPVALGRYELRVAKDGEVTRDRGPGGRELRGDLTGWQRSVAQEMQDLPSGGIGQGFEDGVR